MDILLIFYSLVLGFLFISPILYQKVRKKELDRFPDSGANSPLLAKRNLLLDNLKDLKHEYQTGKSTPEEFEEISSSVISELKQLDEKLKSNNVSNPKPLIEKLPDARLFCNSCKTEIPLERAKFCPSCGSNLELT